MRSILEHKFATIARRATLVDCNGRRWSRPQARRPAFQVVGGLGVPTRPASWGGEVGGGATRSPSVHGRRGAPGPQTQPSAPARRPAARDVRCSASGGYSPPEVRPETRLRHLVSRWSECARAAESGSPRNPWVSWGGEHRSTRISNAYARSADPGSPAKSQISWGGRWPGCRRAASGAQTKSASWGGRQRSGRAFRPHL